jgi:hypothetical protein
MAGSHEQGKGRKIQEQFIAPRSHENRIKAVQLGGDPSGIPLKGFDSVAQHSINLPSDYREIAGQHRIIPKKELPG